MQILSIARVGIFYDHNGNTSHFDHHPQHHTVTHAGKDSFSLMIPTCNLDTFFTFGVVEVGMLMIGNMQKLELMIELKIVILCVQSFCFCLCWSSKSDIQCILNHCRDACCLEGI